MPETLHEFCKNKINPGNLSSNKIFSFQKFAYFLQIRFECFQSSNFCFFKWLVFKVPSVDKTNIPSMEVSDDTHHCSDPDLLSRIPTQEFRFVCFMDDMDYDSITFRNTFFSVDKIGEGDSWIFLDQFRLVLFEPGISI